jgi:hypothetical protein
VAENPNLRLRGHWDRHLTHIGQFLCALLLDDREESVLILQQQQSITAFYFEGQLVSFWLHVLANQSSHHQANCIDRQCFVYN